MKQRLLELEEEINELITEFYKAKQEDNQNNSDVIAEKLQLKMNELRALNQVEKTNYNH